MGCFFNVPSYDGTHYVRCRLYDGIDYSGTNTTSFVIDSTAPTVDVTSLPSWVEGTINANASVSDSTGLNNESCEITIHEVTPSWMSSGVTSNFTYGASAGGCFYDWDTTLYTSGTNYTINYKINDTSNNTGQDASPEWAIVCNDKDPTLCEQACTDTYGSGTYYSGGSGQDKCCGDDSYEDFETNTSEAWCCINSETVANDTTDSTGQFLCYDGAVYSCNNAGEFAFDTDQSSCGRRYDYYCDGAGAGADTWKSQIAASSASDDCDGDNEDPYGEGHSNANANIESCINNKVRNDNGNGIGNQDTGWVCNNWVGPGIATCELNQSDTGNFSNIDLYMEAADELDSGAQFGYIYRVGDYDTVGDTTHYNDYNGTQYPGTMVFNTTSVQDSGNIDSNEGTYGDYLNISLTFDDMENQITDEQTYYFEIGSEESQGSAQILDYEDPNSNEGSCVISGTLCVAVGYTATADSDCCPIGAITSEYPGKDNDDGKCLRCWTNDTQRDGATGTGLCEQVCGASDECDELAIDFSNETISCNTTCGVNYKPITTTPSLTPASPETSDNLNCSFTITDQDSPTLSAYYTWWQDDTDVLSGQVSVTNNTQFSLILLAANTSSGQNWKCEITPYDTIDNGTAKNSSSVAIGNTAPYMDGITETTDPIKGGDQQEINATNPADDDSDDLTLYCCLDDSDSCTPSSRN